ncbi:MAG: transcriptional regulator [Elusimicrobia bacterium]|nr:transcriptional regulator [Elusimicrobiota bacterium]
MRTARLWMGAVLLAAAPVLASAAAPKGWFKSGSSADSYAIGVVKDAASGRKGAYLRSLGSVEKGYGSLTQKVSAWSYLGRRVRLEAFVKADSVKGWGALWMRVDGPYGKVLAFDNMEDRPIRGTKDWKRYEVVLDVPKTAQSVTFGMLLAGEGNLMLSAVRLQAVGKDVPVTAAPVPQPPAKPENLDLEN